MVGYIKRITQKLSDSRISRCAYHASKRDPDNVFLLHATSPLILFFLLTDASGSRRLVVPPASRPSTPPSPKHKAPMKLHHNILDSSHAQPSSLAAPPHRHLARHHCRVTAIVRQTILRLLGNRSLYLETLTPTSSSSPTLVSSSPQP